MSNFVTLLVEDDAFQREAFADLLRDEGFEVIECTTEPPRDCRRLQLLRRWSHDKQDDEQILT